MENTKEEDSENSKGKLKDISNTDKAKQILKQNIQTFLVLKKFLKQTIRKTLVTKPKKKIVRNPREN